MCNRQMRHTSIFCSKKTLFSEKLTKITKLLHVGINTQAHVYVYVTYKHPLSISIPGQPPSKIPIPRIPSLQPHICFPSHLLCYHDSNTPFPLLDPTIYQLHHFLQPLRYFMSLSPFPQLKCQVLSEGFSAWALLTLWAG